MLISCLSARFNRFLQLSFIRLLGPCVRVVAPSRQSGSLWHVRVNDDGRAKEKVRLERTSAMRAEFSSSPAVRSPAPLVLPEMARKNYGEPSLYSDSTY